MATSLPLRATALPSGNCATSHEKAQADSPEDPRRRQGRVVGAQDEVIYLEFSTRKIAALGIDGSPPSSPRCRLKTPSRSPVLSRRDRSASLAGRRAVHLRGHLCDQSSGQRPLLPADGRRHDHPRLRRSADIAVPLQREASHRARHRHEDGWQSACLRQNARQEMGKIIQNLPVGVSVEQVSDQPKVVDEAVGASQRPCSRRSRSCSRSASSASG